jgi:integrase
MPRQVLYPALVRAGVKRIRFQDLRHTCFSHMIAEGVVVTDVSAIAGHASVAFTMSRYAHALPGASGRATSKMEELMQDVF